MDIEGRLQPRATPQPDDHEEIIPGRVASGRAMARSIPFSNN